MLVNYVIYAEKAKWSVLFSADDHCRLTCVFSALVESSDAGYIGLMIQFFYLMTDWVGKPVCWVLRTMDDMMVIDGEGLLYPGIALKSVCIQE